MSQKGAHSSALDEKLLHLPGLPHPLHWVSSDSGKLPWHLLWKPPFISSIHVRAPPLCSHIPVLLYVLIPITFDYHGPPTHLCSPQTVSLPLHVTHPKHSYNFHELSYSVDPCYCPFLGLGFCVRKREGGTAVCQEQVQLRRSLSLGN